MFERLVAALREIGVDPDWRDLRDVLWLALTAELESPPGDGDTAQSRREDQQPVDVSATEEITMTVADRARPTRPAEATATRPTAAGGPRLYRGDQEDTAWNFDARIPRSFALPRQLDLARAMRPLKQSRPSRYESVLDVDGTVEYYCNTKLLVPLQVPARERWFDEVALVLDDNPTMAAWVETVDELGGVMQRLGAFGRVTRWSLRGDEARVHLMSQTGRRHEIQELVDYDGRRLVLVVTDCLGPLWRGDAGWRAAAVWGKYGPAALVQMLPERLWAATAMGAANVDISSDRRGEANLSLRIGAPWWWPEGQTPAQALPVLSLDADRLGPWAGMLMGSGVNVTGVVVPPSSRQREVTRPKDVGPVERLSTFRASVSAEASLLATMLSAVEVSLPVARVLVRKLVPAGRISHLAEVLAGGILQTIPSDESTYDFVPGVRELLQQQLTSSMTYDVWLAVTPYLERSQAGAAPFSLLFGRSAEDAGSPVLRDIVRVLGERFSIRPLDLPATSGLTTPLESITSFLLSVTSTYSDGEEVLRWEYSDRGKTLLEQSGTTRSVRQLTRQVSTARRGTQFTERATELVRMLRQVVPAQLSSALRDIDKGEATLVVTTDLLDVPWHLLPRDQRPSGWESSLGSRSPITVLPQTWTNPYSGELVVDDFLVVLPPPGSKALSGARQESRDLAVAYPVRPVFATDSIAPTTAGGPQVIHATTAAIGDFDLANGPLVFLKSSSTADLATRLLEGGARAVVAPLWPVNERAARRVAERFYAQLAQGSTTCHALTQMRAEMASRESSHTKTALAFQHFGDPSLRITFASPSASAAQDVRRAATAMSDRLVEPLRPAVFAAALVVDLGTDPAASEQVDGIVRWLADPVGASVDEDGVRVIRAPTDVATISAALEQLGSRRSDPSKPLLVLANGTAVSDPSQGPILFADGSRDPSAVALQDAVLALARLHPGGVLAVAQNESIPGIPFPGSGPQETPGSGPIAPWMLVHWPAGHPRLSTIAWAIDDLRVEAPVTGETLREALTASPEDRSRLTTLRQMAQALEGSALDDAGRAALVDARAEVDVAATELAQKRDRGGAWGGVTVKGSDLQRLIIVSGDESNGDEIENRSAILSAAAFDALIAGDRSLIVIDRVSLRQKLYELLQFNMDRVLVVEGPSGSGKSFAAKILRHLARRSDRFEVLTVDFGYMPGITLRSLVEFLSRTSDGETRRVPTFDGAAAPIALARWVVEQSRVRDRPLVWVLDGRPPDVSPDIEMFAVELALMVSRESSASLALVLLGFSHLSGELRNARVAWEQLVPIDSHDVREFVQRTAEQAGRRMGDEDVAEATSQLMSELPAGPDRLAVLSERALQWARSSDLQATAAELERAAEAGDSSAMVRLGELLAERVESPDWEGARLWFERAAEAGEPSAMINLGDLAQLSGDVVEARVAYERSLDLAAKRAARDPGTALWQRDLIVSHRKLGDVAKRSGDVTGARASYGEGLRLAVRLAESDPSNAVWQRDLMVSHRKMGDVAFGAGDVVGARVAYEESLLLAVRLAEVDPTNASSQRDLMVAHRKLGDVAEASDDVVAARNAYEESLGLAARLADLDPSNTRWQRDLEISHDRLGSVAEASDNLTEARDAYAARLELAIRLADIDSTNSLWQRDLLISHRKVGDVARALGDLFTARDAYEASLAVAARLADADPNDARWQRDLFVSHISLGDVALALLDLAAARDAYAASQDLSARMVEVDPTNVVLQGDLALSHRKLGDVAQASGDVPGARAAYEASLDLVTRLALSDPDNENVQREAGDLQRIVSDFEAPS